MLNSFIINKNFTKFKEKQVFTKFCYETTQKTARGTWFLDLVLRTAATVDFQPIYAELVTKY